MFIWQRNGVIRIYKNGQLLATPFLDISAYVNGFDDRGMLASRCTPTSLRTGMCMSAISAKMAAIPTTQAQKLPGSPRFTVNPQTPDVALANSETILLSIPNDAHNHSVGTLLFGPDGKLFMGYGDDSNAGFVDVHSFVAQDLNDLHWRRSSVSMRTAPPLETIPSTMAPIRSSRKSTPMDSAIPIDSPSTRSPENPILQTWGGIPGRTRPRTWQELRLALL